MVIYINNAYSTKMLENALIMQEEIEFEEFNEACKNPDAINCIGHPDTAEIFGVEMARRTIHLVDGDVLFICEMNNKTGTRLPEGITRMSELPEGAYFRFLKITVLEAI